MLDTFCSPARAVSWCEHVGEALAPLPPPPPPPCLWQPINEIKRETVWLPLRLGDEPPPLVARGGRLLPRCLLNVMLIDSPRLPLGLARARHRLGRDELQERRVALAFVPLLLWRGAPADAPGAPPAAAEAPRRDERKQGTLLGRAHKLEHRPKLVLLLEGWRRLLCEWWLRRLGGGARPPPPPPSAIGARLAHGA